MKKILIVLLLLALLLGCGSKLNVAGEVKFAEFDPFGQTFEPPPSPFPFPFGETQFFGSISTVEKWTDAQVGHFTQSGFEDLVFRISEGAAQGQIWLLESDGSMFKGRLLATVSSVVNWKYQTVLDFNGDGLSDLALFEAESGGWWVGLNDGLHHLNFQPAGHFSPSVDWKYIRAVDYDSDGKDDILSVDPTTRKIWVGISDGSVFHNASIGNIPAEFGLPLDESLLAVGKCDADQFADIVIRDAASGLWGISHLTNGVLTFASNNVFSNSMPWQFFFGSFFLPGVLSIGGFSSASGDLLASGTQGTLAGTFSSSEQWMHFLTGRFNGGDVDDIAAISKATGEWWLGSSKGGQFKNQFFGGWIPPAHLEWKDVVKGRFRRTDRDSIVGQAQGGFYVLTKN